MNYPRNMTRESALAAYSGIANQKVDRKADAKENFGPVMTSDQDMAPFRVGED